MTSTPPAPSTSSTRSQRELSSSGAAPGTEGQQLLGRLLGILGAETEAGPA